jgi:hypothetical protein
MISRGWIISHRCSWITVYVLCCNAQINLIVIFMTCTCIVMHSLFCQLPNCNLFTQHIIYLYGETPPVKLWTPIHSFTFILPSIASIVYFRKYYFTSPQTNISFHTVRLILCCQQNQWDWQPHYKLGQSSLVVLCAGSTLMLASTMIHQLSSGALSKVS